VGIKGFVNCSMFAESLFAPEQLYAGTIESDRPADLYVDWVAPNKDVSGS
jgi:hypothetical protein